MDITSSLRQRITEDLLQDFNGKFDGSRRNLLIPQCPFCGKDGYKFAIYVGNDTGSKKFGMCNCFKCGRSSRTLKETLELLDHEYLLPKETTELDENVADLDDFFEDDIDDDLVEIEMPRGYRRCFKNRYLKSRGFIADDYEYFPCGTNRGMDREFDDYVLIEIRDANRLVGYVARSILSKEEIDEYNEHHRYQIRRYNNSKEQDGNAFEKLLYNIDAVEPYKTHSVILCEGVFDVIALTRKLELYDNKSIVPVCTFGKKISETQMYKLQAKGVEQIVIGYDSDAKETTTHIATQLEKYFDVLIADIPEDGGKDWDEMSVDSVYDIFAYGLKTIREFNLEG